jgi:hypothetical protein
MSLCNEGVDLDRDRPVEAFERFAKATQIIRLAAQSRDGGGDGAAGSTIPSADMSGIRSRLKALELQATERMHAIEARLKSRHAPQAAPSVGSARSSDPLASAARIFSDFFKRPVSTSDAPISSPPPGKHVLIGSMGRFASYRVLPKWSMHNAPMQAGLPVSKCITGALCEGGMP